MSQNQIKTKKITPYSAAQGVQLEKTMGKVQHDVAVLKDDVIVLKDDVTILKQDVSILKTDVTILKYDMSQVKGDVSNIRQEMASNHNEVMTKLDKMVGMMVTQQTEQVAHTAWLKRHDRAIEKITS